MSTLLYAYGCGSPIRLPIIESLAHGSLANEFIPYSNPKYRGGDSIIWGLIRGAKELMDETQRSGFDYYQMDNAYFGRNIYFRITKNALQLNYLPKVIINNRYQVILNQFGKKILRWNKVRNGPIVICPSSNFLYQYMGTTLEYWIKSVVEELKKITGRPYIIRYKEAMSSNDIDREIENAWCVITHVSAAALDALRLGVPIVTTANCAASCLSTPFNQIEKPIMDEGREELFSLLANSQFSQEEMLSNNVLKLIHKLNENINLKII